MLGEVGGFGIADFAFSEGGGNWEFFKEFVPALGDKLFGLGAFEFFRDPLHSPEFGEGLTRPLREAKELFEGIEVIEVGEVLTEAIFDMGWEFGRRIRVLGMDVWGGMGKEVIVSGLRHLEIGRRIAEIV